MENDLTDNLLAGRAPLLIHTTELSHNEVVNRRDGFGRFVGTSKLTMIPK